MKRTLKLDQEQQVALPQLGTDVFTTKGDFELTPDEKVELEERLNREGPLRQLTEQFVLQVMTEQAAFLEAIYETLTSDDDARRFHVSFDAEICAAHVGERVLAVYKPKLPKYIHAAVRLTIQNVNKAARAGVQPGGGVQPSNN